MREEEGVCLPMEGGKDTGCEPRKRRTGIVSTAVVCDVVILILQMKKQKFTAVVLHFPGKRENRYFGWQH